MDGRSVKHGKYEEKYGREKRKELGKYQGRVWKVGVKSSERKSNMEEIGRQE